ncbi:MAG: threonylcarbamoyl-AMP synthase [Planctomycetes bacterium]|nr:threonylcarbamoyl-AMP synthase [Planctomycetota bacterium]
MICMVTEVIDVKNRGDGADEQILRASAVVDGGGLVGFATETVYGIACAAEPEAIARLDSVKGRSPEKRYSLHISGPAEIDRYVPRISAPALRLLRRAWPGPLTAVFELDEGALQGQRAVVGDGAFDILYRGGTIGVRCPDCWSAGRLLGAAKSPIVAPSANLSGEAPATTAGEVLAAFDGKIEIILDTGPTKYKKSSTVVKITDAGTTILREGVFSRDDINEMTL